MVLVVGASFVFMVLPQAVDRIKNGVVIREAPIPSEVHRRLRVVDLHADTLLWKRDILVRGHRGHVDQERLREGNVSLQVLSVVTKSPRGLNIEKNSDRSDNIPLLAFSQLWPMRTWTSLMERALFQAEKLEAAVMGSGGSLRMIADRQDLSVFLEERRTDPDLTGVILALEGSHALEGKIENMGVLADRGFRILAPTHLFDSEWAGSQAGERKGGLTELGRLWVAEMNRRHLIIDLAHASTQTIDEVLAITSRPVMVSHTGVRSVCSNNRNLTDEQIRRIAENGGIIGVGFWKEALCDLDYRTVAKTLRHILNVGGPRAASLGSDWDGFVTTVSDAAGLPLLTDILRDEGFNDEEIRNVMGENALHFLMRELPPG